MQRIVALGVELREVIGLVADDGDAERFESFERGGQIEDGLRSGADDAERRGGEGGEVCGDVGAAGPVGMNAANAAGGKDERVGVRGLRIEQAKRGERR